MFICNITSTSSDEHDHRVAGESFQIMQWWWQMMLELPVDVLCNFRRRQFIPAKLQQPQPHLQPPPPQPPPPKAMQIEIDKHSSLEVISCCLVLI